MSDSDENTEIVEIDFEVGHMSIIRSEPTTNHNPPRTHDWKIYLRSADINGDLNCLIQRCVFLLHPDYPNHKRELRTTPFAVQETGYAGFHLPIEIYFKTKKEPRKFSIEYDLDLHKNIDGHPHRQKQCYVQKYRCTFHNPDPTFRQKILAAGGKIVDSGPITLNNTDQSDIDEEQVSVIRHSPPQKRPYSPVPTANMVNNKKVKLDPSINNTKKKQIQPVVKNENPTKTIVNTKKSKLVSHKSSSVLDEKTPKTKELNQTLNVHKNTDTPLLSKPRTSIKLIKSQSTNDIKPSIQSATINTKKKESALSPSKTKPVINSQNGLKKIINKNPHKISIKTERISTPPVQSPSNVITKQESPPQPLSTTTTTSVSISNLKKIPKKLIPPSVAEKRSRASMPASALNRNSVRDSQKQASLSSKAQSTLKRDHSSSSVHNHNSHRSEKINTNKDHSDQPAHQSSALLNNKKRQTPTPPPPQSIRSASQTPTPPKSILSPAQSHIDLPMNSTVPLLSPIDTSQLTDSPSPPIFQNEDNHIQPSMDIDDHMQLSDKSNSSQERTLIAPAKIASNRTSYSDQSDTHDSDNEGDEEEDLPTSLTNDDLRYKLIYIYKRFQLNSLNDLITFAHFFKRHQLIDISSLSMTKATNEMFTYDLFSLSPSHIIELANDLGYSTTSIINSIEQ